MSSTTPSGRTSQGEHLSFGTFSEEREDLRKGFQTTGVVMAARRPLRRTSLAMLVLASFITFSGWAALQGPQAGGSVAKSKATGTDSSCTGKPLQFTSIASLTGPLSVPSLTAETKNATAAALKAVNSQCALGRPIAIDLCDDKSDPNAAQQCG